MRTANRPLIHLSEQMNTMLTELPLEKLSGLNFRFWDYRVSHSVMLWRSYTAPISTDLVFLGVIKIQLVCAMESLILVEATPMGDNTEFLFHCRSGETKVLASNAKLYQHEGGPFFDAISFFT